MTHEGAGAVDDLPVVGEADGAVVEQDVMVGAQTENVGEVIDALVAGTERHQVSTFRVGTGCGLQTDATDLTGEVVEAFDGLRNVPVAD